MRKVHNVRVMLKSYRPCQSVVIASIFASHGVLIVADVATTSYPAFACAFGLSFGIDEWAHSVIVQTVGLHQVDDIETILLTRPCVCNPEIVPLSVASRIVVRLQDQIILVLVHLNCSA